MAGARSVRSAAAGVVAAARARVAGARALHHAAALVAGRTEPDVGAFDSDLVSDLGSAEPLLSPFEWPLPSFVGDPVSSIGKDCWASFLARTSSVMMPRLSR